MKYLIVSDIHGALPTLELVLDFYRKEKCDMLCILGDILNYGPRNRIPEGIDAKGIAERLNSMADEIIAVRGNCDAEVDQMLLDFPIMADYALLVDDTDIYIMRTTCPKESTISFSTDIHTYGSWNRTSKAPLYVTQAL